MSRPVRISMVEYQGRCDIHGKAVGHAPKVLREYLELNKDSFDIDIYAPDTILAELPDGLASSISALPHGIVMKGGNTLSERIRNKLNMFSNIRFALKSSDADIIWFFNVEFYFFLYLALFGSDGKRIAVTLFRDGYHHGALSGIKQKVFEAGQKRVAGCISAGPLFSFKNMPSVFIPDYIYDPDTYDRSLSENKEDYAVCLGTMGDEKQLEELIPAFSRISYPLLVAGRFYDKSRYARLRDAAGSNIEIRDTYLSDEEYMPLLCRARYAVLPYLHENYSAQTSGVMQEAVFADTVVLTHEMILRGNAIPGVGFKGYDDISDDMLSGAKSAERNRSILKEYERLRNDTYDKTGIKKKYREFFEGLK